MAKTHDGPFRSLVTKTGDKGLVFNMRIPGYVPDDLAYLAKPIFQACPRRRQLTLRTGIDHTSVYCVAGPFLLGEPRSPLLHSWLGLREPDPEGLDLRCRVPIRSTRNAQALRYSIV